MAILNHYEELMGRGAAAFQELRRDADALASFTKAHNSIPEFELILGAIVNRPEAKLLSIAISEYQYSLLAVSNGMYRHAYVSLRLFFEQALSTVYFSAHEIKFHKWMANSQDIIWTALIDDNEGVLSKTFLSAFFPGVEDLAKQYRTLAGTVYRECSEFVHGNYHTCKNAENPIGFEVDMFNEWIERADAVRLSVLFAFMARYLRHIPKAEQTKLEALILDNFGHVGCVQEVYGM